MSSYNQPMRTNTQKKIAMTKKERKRLVKDYMTLSGTGLEFVSDKIDAHINTLPIDGCPIVLFCVETIPLDDPVIWKLRGWVDAALNEKGGDVALGTVSVGKMYTIDLPHVRNRVYRGRVCEAIESTEDGRWAVRVLGVGTRESPVVLDVKPGVLEPLDEAGSDECPVCLDPLCEFDCTLLCGHRLHEYCLDSVRANDKRVLCPTCRAWAGEGGGEFKMDWSKANALEVLGSSLSVLHVMKKNKGIEAAKAWACSRIKLSARNKEVVGDVLPRLIRYQHQDILKAREANGAPFYSKFIGCLVEAVALALPSAAWEPEFRRWLETTAPGQNSWERGSVFLTGCLMKEL
jgi:hypothetical protein